MPQPTLLACVALAALLLSPTHARAGDRGPVVVPDGKARIRAYRADAKALAASRFPTKADLGPNWFLPWEAPKAMPTHLANEASYWNHMKINEAWAQFFEMSEADIVKVARTSIDEGFARMGGADTSGVPAALRSFMSKPGALSMSLGLIRRFTVLAEKPQALFAIESQGLAAEIMMSALLEPAKRKEHQARLQAESIALIGADLRGHAYDDALGKLARDIRSVRRAATMSYVSGDAEAWKRTTSSRDVPDHGVFLVEMYVLADSGTNPASGDLLPSEVAATRKRFTAAVRGILDGQRKLAAGQANAQIERLEQQLQSYTTMGRDTAYLQKRLDEIQASLDASASISAPKVDVQTLDAGENAWVASIRSTMHDGRPYTKYFGRLRNGNAVVNVTGSGTHPPARMLEDLTYMLGAMDAQTNVFGDD